MVLLNRFAFLVCNSAGSLASRLAGRLALAAAALLGGSLETCLVDRNNVLHWEHLFQICIAVTAISIIS